MVVLTIHPETNPILTLQQRDLANLAPGDEPQIRFPISSNIYLAALFRFKSMTFSGPSLRRRKASPLMDSPEPRIHSLRSPAR